MWNKLIYLFIILMISCTESKEDKKHLGKVSDFTNQNQIEMTLIQDQLMQWVSYELVGTAQTYIESISALAEKAEHSKVNGLSRYSFYVNEETKSAGAIIVYDSPQAFIDWHELAPAFEEYEAFKKSVKLTGLKLYGNLSPDAKKWIEDRNIPFEYAGKFAGGFMR